MKYVLFSLFFFFCFSFSHSAVAMSVKEMKVGTKIEKNEINYENYFQSFEIYENDEIYQRIIGKSYPINHAISCSSLRYLKLLHYNYHHDIVVGEMIVNRYLAEEVLAIFQKLFEHEVEIFSIRLIDDFFFNSSDPNEADFYSMISNNTSAFNYRNITSSNTLSNHSKGMAIDINPIENPYVSKNKVEPSNTKEEYTNEVERNSSSNPHVIRKGDIIYSTFQEFGFEWGGEWNSLKDYQHFEKVVSEEVSKEVEEKTQNFNLFVFLLFLVIGLFFISHFFKR